MPFLPGTFGTIVGVIIYLLLNQYTFIYYPLILILFYYGAKFSAWGEKYFKQKDSRRIVIDEIVGFFIALWNIRIGFSLIPFRISDYKLLLLGFILFRIFDIIKPYPIRQLEKIGKGYGVMLDDVMAGVYTNIVLIIIQTYRIF